MRTAIKKSEKQEFYWTLKKITSTWIWSGMQLKKESRETGIKTE
jgi:hypothetical protein